MTQRMQKTLQECKGWSPEERAELAAQLIDSLDPDQDADVQEAWEAEIAKRLDDIDRGIVQCISAEDAHRRLQEVIDAHQVRPSSSR